jgi:hypothetical protein
MGALFKWGYFNKRRGILIKGEVLWKGGSGKYFNKGEMF